MGISNFFTDPTNLPTNWLGCVAFADIVFPGSTLVGYEVSDV